MIKRKIVIVLLSIVSAILFATGAGIHAKSKNPGDSPIAVVNGVKIPRSELDRATQTYKRQMAMKGEESSPEQIAEMENKVLDGLIDRELLYQQSQKMGIKVDQKSIDEKIDALKKRFASEEQYREALNQMNLSEGVIRSQYEREMAITEFIDKEFENKVTVSDAEVKTFYDDHPDFFKTPERVRASHILVQVSPDASEAVKKEARKKIEDIQTKLKKGDDFAKLAKEYSDCPSSAKGGDLDYFQRGQMVGPFEDAAFSLKEGQVSDVVETRFGYHLIKVTDKKEAGVVSLADSKERIREYLKQQKINEELTQYLAKLKKKADIKKFN